MQKQITKFFLFLTLFLIVPRFANATGTYLNFNDFPVTADAPGSVPGDSSTWQYSSSVTNYFAGNPAESFGSGWLGKTAQSDGVPWFFTYSKDLVGKCYDHMGVDTYGYLDIASNGHSGNALRHNITGGLPISSFSGICPNSPAGTPLYNKESYTNSNQIYTGGKIGLSDIYFKRIDAPSRSIDTASQRIFTPYDAVAGANRMSAYIYLPAETNNGSGKPAKSLASLQQTYQMGLFLNGDSNGFHHYYNFYTQGGGWAKMQIEETTNGDNSGTYAWSGYTRYIPNMLKGGSQTSEYGDTTQGLWQFYFASQPYAGMATPPWDVKIDDIAFDDDTYAPQNNETISNIAVLYKEASKTWEISFNDKYKNTYSYSTYQVKYSSSPITNENWNSATPINVLPDVGFAIDARNDGKFQKWAPDYQGVWAPFKLSDADTNNLAPNQTIYFAVKDISQVGGNTQVPNDTILTTGYPYDQPGRGGRDYSLYASSFDYANDQAALPYIKRISYTLADNISADIASPAAPTALSVQ